MCCSHCVLLSQEGDPHSSTFKELNMAIAAREFRKAALLQDRLSALDNSPLKAPLIGGGNHAQVYSSSAHE